MMTINSNTKKQRRTMNMSENGLYNNIYEQLRVFADKLDRALVRVRNTQEEINACARKDIAAILRELTDSTTTNPMTRLVAFAIKRDLTTDNLVTLQTYQSLSQELIKRPATAQELEQLEQLAIALDRECTTTLARLRGKA